MSSCVNNAAGAGTPSAANTYSDHATVFRKGLAQVDNTPQADRKPSFSSWLGTPMHLDTALWAQSLESADVV